MYNLEILTSRGWVVLKSFPTSWDAFIGKIYVDRANGVEGYKDETFSRIV